MKLVVEDKGLRSQIVEYLAANGTEVDENTPVSITLPGAGSAPQRCQSGSGKMTAGGRFAPGYDAKLKSSLYAIIRGNPDKVSPELLENGPMYVPVADWTPEKATAALDEFGWPHPTIKPPKAPKAEKADGADGDAPTRKGRKAKKEGEAEAVEETV